MNHQGTQTIITERLILRPFVVADAEGMYHNWASDPEVTKFLSWQPHVSAGATAQLLSDWTSHYTELTYYNWAMELKEEREVVGSLGVVRQDERTQSMEIGYCIGKKWWNRGLTTEALTAVVAFLFEEVAVNRIELHHDTNNPASGRVMAKSGLTLEGTHRRAGINNQGICDLAVYAILAEDYRAGKAEA